MILSIKNFAVIRYNAENFAGVETFDDMGIYGLSEHCLMRSGPCRMVPVGMSVMLNYFAVLLGRVGFIARCVQRYPIAVKITIEVPVVFCAYDTQIPLAWIAWEQTAGF